jgi:hypothetical protein
MSKKQKQNLWVARDKNGWLHLFNAKPVYRTPIYIGIGLGNGCWDAPEPDSYLGVVPTGFFPDVTFENSPQRVHLQRNKIKL